MGSDAAFGFSAVTARYTPSLSPMINGFSLNVPSSYMFANVMAERVGIRFSCRKAEK